MVHDGLVSTFDGKHMVEQASFVSRELGISREEQDAWACRSHAARGRRARRRALRRRDRPGRRARRVDESPRRDTSLEKLAALKPVFDPEGTTTAGNAPGRQRRRLAACSSRARSGRSRRGIEPLATIVSQGYVAGEFAYLARTPAKAAGIALARAGKTIDDVARVEINEAFASVACNSTRLLGADEEQVNVNGGAVALGHPIGASGGGSSPRSSTTCAATAAASASQRSARAAARATRS